jgi:hypothetical protein
MNCRLIAAPLAGALAALAVVGLARTASADGASGAMTGSSDLGRVFTDGVRWVNTMKTDARNDTRDGRAESDEKASQSTTYGDASERRPPVVLLPTHLRLTDPSAERPRDATKEERSWRKLSPALVARDWRGSYAVFGKDLPSDNIRLTRSSRMLLARLTMGDGRIKPFAHFGVGEWRFDPFLMPLVPRNQEYATQFSGGVSIDVWKGTTFVWETDYTVLVRDAREPQNLPTPHVLGSFAILETHL